MNKVKVKIGFAPSMRYGFEIEEAIKYKNLVLKGIKNYNADVIDINDINDTGMLFDSNDTEKVVKRFVNAEIDGIFTPLCNFGTEDLIAKVAKAIGKPLLLWGPRDDEPLENALRTRDTQCGIFATSKVLRRFNIPFTYIINSNIDDVVFKRGYNNFISVCSVIKAFKSIRILQIAPRPFSFWSVISNEGELLEKFGIEVFPITLQDVATDMTRILSEKGKNFRENLEYILSNMEYHELHIEAIERIAALKTMMNLYCEREKCTAVAIQCWDALQDTIGIMPCVSNGMLAQEGIPVACETDLHGAISSILVQEASLRVSPTFIADFTVRHPFNDNAELLSHCGNYSVELAKRREKRRLGYNFISPQHSPGIGEWEVKGGDVTICRFDGDHGEYSLLIGEGKAIEGPKTKGTYLWFEVKDWPKWEEKIVTGPYAHHCSCVHAKVAPVLYESCKYITGLTPDPIEPSKEEIQRFLRGF